LAEVDKKQFSNRGSSEERHLVAVVSPDEWEAIAAARSVAASAKWTEWTGLPGSENLTKALREFKWGAPSESKGKAADVIAGVGECVQNNFREL